MEQTFILKIQVAYWANLPVMTCIDWMARDFGDFYYPESAYTVKYILMDILICNIREQCSDQQESKWKC